MVFDTYFPLDELRIPWGELQQEVLRRTPNRAWYHDDSGSFASVGRCQSVAGMPATTCRLWGPAPNKPVQQADYQLAINTPNRAETLALGMSWRACLTALLGPPTDQRPKADELVTGNPLLAVWWQFPTCWATLGVYDVERPDDYRAEASFKLEWKDVQTAAQPFLADWQAQQRQLDTAPIREAEVEIINLQQKQYGTLPATDPAGIRLQEANLALNRQNIYRTPQALQGQLNDQQAALWYVASCQAWAVSKRATTVLLTPENSFGAINLTIVHPAKGEGYTIVGVGDLTLYDVYKSVPLQQLTASLETRLAVTAKHYESHDC